MPKAGLGLGLPPRPTSSKTLLAAKASQSSLTGLGGLQAPGTAAQNGEAGPSQQPQPTAQASAEQQSRVFQEVAKRLNERLASHGVAGKGPMTEASVRQALDHLARGGPEAMSATVDVTHGRVEPAPRCKHASGGGKCGEQDPMESEEAQSCWELYQRAYLVHLDVAFPPLFAALVAMCFLLNILPFLIALFVVPMAFLMGTSLCLVKVAGMPTRAIPFSYFPAATVVALELAAILTFAFGMFPMFVVALLPCAAFFLLAGSALYLQYRTWTLDPGFVPLGPPLPDGPLDPGRRALLQAQNPAWCYTCNAYRPIRSKHCGQCGRCCEEFDHHCPVVGTCVARGNRREFLGYLLTLFGAEAVMLGMGVRYCRLLILRALHLRTLPGLLEVLPHMALVWRASPGVLYMLVLTVGICMGTAALLGRALWGTAAALTTNEMILRRRYAYLQDTQGLYSNPFDMGAWQNCLAFWSTARPDWYSVYSEHCTALREGEEPLAHPLATRILRRWDRARAALERARFEKKARREEELLRRGSQLAASEGEAESEIEAV
ncbi:hypothetical protein ACKKBF_B05780 [Auxenochlorella protothecoides x Auxenochlorella symbiontica]